VTVDENNETRDDQQAGDAAGEGPAALTPEASPTAVTPDDAAPVAEPSAEPSVDAAEQPIAEEPAAAEDVAAEPAADEPATGQPGAEEPAAPSAVSLGLLPETFVSAVSTDLHFYAPQIALLPPLPVEPKPAEPNGSRRRNRRRGGDTEDTRERIVEVVTEPQRIKGSTRLEAKKQRRRDGREAGRRRPVVTEAEFLARRESVDREMIVRSKNGRIQIGVLEDKVLAEHYVARSQDASLIGNVYLGRVQNVLPSMEAAFVDIGRGRNAVLYSGEVDWDGVETGNQPRRIERALKSGDRVLVQVTK
jgi:ribonuclease E